MGKLRELWDWAATRVLSLLCTLGVVLTLLGILHALGVGFWASWLSVGLVLLAVMAAVAHAFSREVRGREPWRFYQVGALVVAPCTAVTVCLPGMLPAAARLVPSESVAQVVFLGVLLGTLVRRARKH